MKMKTWFAAVLVGAIITGTVIAFAGNGVNLLTQARPEVVQRATMPGISCAVVTATDGIIRFRIVAWKIEALKSDAIKECYGRAVNSTPGPNDQDSIWAPISSYFEGVRCYKNRKLVAIEFGDPRANE